MFNKKSEFEKMVEEMSTLLHKHNLTELEYKKGNIQIKVSNHQMGVMPSFVSAPPVPATGATKVENNTAVEVSVDLTKAVKSPMVGVVYLKSDPKSPAFVTEGQQVKKGDTLCLIEAMKTFNPVKADKDGTVKKILVTDSETIEYDQPLFILE